jgi:D-glycero-D-manno-heptose 1,7-bisphosphate phosphatase
LGLVVITNQSGIARGYFDLETLSRIHRRLREILAAEDIALDGVYFCPHGPEDGCRCRKPLPGMVEQAAADHDFDPGEAFLVGDSAADIGLGRAVGAVPLLVRTGWGRKTEAEAACEPEVVVEDLAEAAEWIARRLNGAASTAG